MDRSQNIRFFVFVILSLYILLRNYIFTLLYDVVYSIKLVCETNEIIYIYIIYIILNTIYIFALYYDNTNININWNTSSIGKKI